MAQVEIQRLSSTKAIMALWDDLLKVPMIGIQPEQVIARAIDGTYDTIIGLRDGHQCGFMIYGVNRDVLTVIALYLPKYAKEFVLAFNTWCLSLGVKVWYATSPHNPAAFGRLFELNYIYGVFSKEVV
jgi:hypothetical protein